MTDVHIEKVDNIMIRIIADNSVRMGMSEHFTRFAAGYMFSPKYKNKIWDGKIRFLHYATGNILAGLIPEVLEYCKDEGLSVKIDPEVKELYQHEYDPTEYIDSLVLHAHGKRVELRDYQRKAAITCIKQKRKLVVSPTSSGKSALAFAITRYFDHRFDDDEQILIVVPNLSLIHQMKSDFRDYSVLDGWDVDKKVGMFSGEGKQPNHRVVLATWQSIYKFKRNWFNKFRAIIVDEVHQAKASGLQAILKNCDAEFRIGLTGTLDKDETNQLTIKGCFGSIMTTVTTKELMDQGVVADLSIKCIKINYEGIERYKDYFKKRDYAKEIDFLISQKSRNNFIVDLANTVNGNVLVLFDRVEKHGKVLVNLAKKYNEGKEVFMVYGGTATDDRENIRKLAETHKGCIIIASYKTFSTGVSVRAIHNIIFASPTKSFVRVVQSIGRGLRVSESKTKCDLYDLADHIYGNEKNNKWNYTMTHFIERIKIYSEQKFKFDIEQVSLEANNE